MGGQKKGWGTKFGISWGKKKRGAVAKLTQIQWGENLRGNYAGAIATDC